VKFVLLVETNGILSVSSPFLPDVVFTALHSNNTGVSERGTCFFECSENVV